MTQTARKTEKPQKMVTTKQYEGGVMAEFLGFDGWVAEVLEPIFMLLLVISVVRRVRDTFLKKDRPKDKNNGANREENGKNPRILRFKLNEI